MKRFLLAIGFVALCSGAAWGQGTPNSAQVVSVCGTPPGTYTPGQNKPVTQDTTGRQCSDNSGTVVSGTVTANQGTSGASPWPIKVDQTTPGTTNGVVVNSSSLPTGASSSALQSNVQSAAGTPSATAITVQGNASGIAVPVSGTVVVTGHPVGITPTDRFIASATGGSQQIMPANPNRHSLLIQNLSSTNNCAVNPFGGAAGSTSSLVLPPFGSYQPAIPTLSAVNIVCTATTPIYGEEN